MPHIEGGFILIPSLGCDSNPRGFLSPLFPGGQRASRFKVTIKMEEQKEETIGREMQMVEKGSYAILKTVDDAEFINNANFNKKQTMKIRVNGKLEDIPYKFSSNVNNASLKAERYKEHIENGKCPILKMNGAEIVQKASEEKNHGN